MPLHPKGLLDAVNTGIAEADAEHSNYGLRPNGTPKGEGWLGLLKRPDGKLSTEITAGVQFNGKETDIPLIVPTLSADEVRYLLSANIRSPDFYAKLPPSIMQKAIAHATKRLAAGLSPYDE